MISLRTCFCNGNPADSKMQVAIALMESVCTSSKCSHCTWFNFTCDSNQVQIKRTAWFLVFRSKLLLTCNCLEGIVSFCNCKDIFQWKGLQYEVYVEHNFYLRLNLQALSDLSFKSQVLMSLACTLYFNWQTVCTPTQPKRAVLICGAETKLKINIWRLVRKYSNNSKLPC